MKVLFLDVDGVLNTDKTRRDNGLEFIDPIRVNLVNDIVDRTGCEVVLSSSWRVFFKQEKLHKMFKEAGLKKPLHDFTPVARAPDGRGDEIMRWLEDQGEVTFAIVDDDVFDITPIFSEDVVVQTNDDDGLTPEHAENLIKILGGGS